MEADQTGFSGSPPSAGAATPDHDAAADATPVARISIKDEPEDESPAMTEEQWRAYYQQPIMVLNGEEGAIYATADASHYKLPPINKFGKNMVGKFPIWASVAVSPPDEGEELSPGAAQQGSPEEPPYHKEREDSVIQAPEKEKEAALPLLAPTAVEVKDGASPPQQHEDMEVATQQAAAQSPADIQLEGAPYQVSEFSNATYEPLGTGQYSVLTNVVVTVNPPQYGAQTTGNYITAADYYTREPTPADHYSAAVRQQLVSAAYGENVENQAFVERYIRQSYKPTHGLSVDLPSPDSGIGGEATVTPRDSLHQIFDYTEIAHGQPGVLQPTDEDSSTSRSTPVPSSPARKNSWNHEYGRNAELDKVQIPKVFSDVGFHYYLESPISTSQRREDDRMTYINKGQYYGITLEYINDPERTLRSCTVKSTVMLVFREEKSPEDELKAWKFWHSRQHSVKQRILDADTKNSCGIVGQIEEITHNAIAFYWNPMEGPAKISISVHCLSTDFSNQKGVKGFPLHIQIDTTDDLRDGAPPIHRGYCQIKVFCDKGAERKTRDEERRAAKRKLTATGTDGGNVFTGSRKKIEEMYHSPCERSEFYSMSDISKPPILFTPDEDAERPNGPELAFYTIAAAAAAEDSVVAVTIPHHEPFPSRDVKQAIELPVSPPLKKFKAAPPDRVLLYVRRPEEEIFHPLHLVPPTLHGLAKALENKYSINSDMMRHFYKKCKKGITVIMDDDIVRLYSNEDTFILDIIKTEDNQFDVTLEEL